MKPTDQGEEIVFYSDSKGIRVTNSRFIVNHTTYSMRNVTSVSKERAQPNRAIPFVFFIAAAVIGLAAVEDPYPLALYAVGCAMGGVLVWLQQKPDFNLVLSSSSGDSTAVSSREESYIDQIARALNEAIMSNH